MFGYIYITTNLVNGKKYIGQHEASHFEGNKYLGSGINLTKAIKKYGESNFKVELLEKCNSKQELDKAEISYIKKFNAADSDDFYNITYGGQGGDFFTEGMKDKLRKARLSQKSQTKGKRKINNGIREKLVTPEELDSYLSDGWKLGSLFISNEGYVYVTRDGKTTAIPPEQLSEYLENGWVRGNGGSGAHKGTCHINNGEVSKMIPIADLDDYLSKGWIRGRIYKRRATTIESVSEN